jgi:hypothetical protein
MSEPGAVSRRATAWWPVLVGLEEVVGTVTATAGVPGLPSDESLKPVTEAVRSALAMLAAGTSLAPAGS